MRLGNRRNEWPHLYSLFLPLLLLVLRHMARAGGGKLVGVDEESPVGIAGVE